MTSATVARRPRASIRRASCVHERTRSTRACFLARSISRSLITITRVLPFCTKRKGSGAKKRVA